jgi:predicted nucleic acid-binding protein
MKYNYVLDSYAWAEFFNGTEKGEKVKKIIEEGNIATSIITLAEFSDKCAREERDITPIVEYIQSKAAILSLNQETALNAGKLKYELRKISKILVLLIQFIYKQQNQLMLYLLQEIKILRT